MIVTHITPATFGSNGIFGGGERYPVELARAMSELVETRLVSFSETPRSYDMGALSVRLHKVSGYAFKGELNPLSAPYLKDIFQQGDVLHTHQYEAVPTNLALLTGKLRGRPVFCTDHGGRSKHAGNKLHLERILTGFLPISDFSLQTFPQLAPRSRVIYGGFDPLKFYPVSSPRSDKVVFVGRILPHKGIDLLIEALPKNVRLDIYGHAYDSRYLTDLHNLAEGKPVQFIHDASDDDVAAAYRSARVVVLPSLLKTRYGDAAPKSELFGLTLIEAMACATPVICTRVGGMPEVVRDGETGFVVEPGDVPALRGAIEQVISDDRNWQSMSDAAAEWAQSKFTWSRIAQNCLDAYADFGRVDVGAAAVREERRLRIILATSAPDVGGVSKHMSDLARGLSAAGNTVSFALTDARKQRLHDEFAHQGYLVESLAESLKREADVWHFHSHKTFDWGSLTTKARAALVGRSSKRILTEHLPHVAAADPALMYDPTIPAGRKKPGAYFAKTHLKRFELALFDRVILVSRGSRDFMAKRYGLPSNKLAVVYNGLEAATHEGPAQVGSHALRIVVVGVLGWRKGIDTLLSAAAFSTSPWDITIYGDGQLRSSLEAQSKSCPPTVKVTFAGWAADARAQLSSHDVLCMPSRTESFPYAALEGMFAARPVVASDIEGLNEVVLDGVTGFLVQPDDPDSLAEALNSLAADPALRMRMGRAARIRVERHFSLEKMLSTTIGIYQETGGQPRRTSISRVSQSPQA